MKRAVIYGAGNIGRGFIGALFAQSGYRVTFVDIASDIVCMLHEQGQYPVRVVRSEGYTDLTITNVDAINGNDIAAVAHAMPMILFTVWSACGKWQGIYTVEHAAECGVELVYLNTAAVENPVAALLALTGGTGYDDVICFAPVRAVVEQADAILGFDGCLNFFAGPSDTAFSASVNFYNVHYASHHLVGTSGGNTDDMREAIALMNAGKINPAAMITHIGGLDCAAETTANLPRIPGGKKLIYNHIELPLTALADFGEKGKADPLFQKLDEVVKAHNNLWCAEAEEYLLAHAKTEAN